MFCVKNIFSAKPCIIDQVVLLIANPCRSKYFGFAFDSILLFLLCFCSPRFYNIAIVSDNRIDLYLIISTESVSILRIIIGSPYYISTGAFILQKDSQQLVIQLLNGVFFNVDAISTYHLSPNLILLSKSTILLFVKQFFYFFIKIGSNLLCPIVNIIFFCGLTFGINS